MRTAALLPLGPLLPVLAARLRDWAAAGAPPALPGVALGVTERKLDCARERGVVF